MDWCQKTYHIRCAQKAGCEINALEWILSCPEHSRKFRAQAKQGAPQGRDQGGLVTNRKRVSGGLASNSNRGKRPRPSPRLNPFSDPVDLDEEIFQKKQQYRIQRDIKALKPYALGSEVCKKSQSQGQAGGAGDVGKSEEKETPFDAGWESVGGHEDVKRALKEAVLLPLMYQSEFSNLNLTCPKGVLLYGEPGTGKTMVVRALANECNKSLHIKKISFFSRKGADLLGKFQGEAERKLRLLFQEAQNSAPSIIFFDELDGIAPARGGRVSDQIHTSVVSTLLSLMDGLVDRGKVVVLAATNRADAIDPALRRPGRFDREIYFPLPDLEQRAKIISACTRKWSVKPQSEQVERMAVLTEGFAGADLQSLCTNAALGRLRREFPTILDGVEENRRIENFDSKLDAISVEDRDFVFALQNITNACSHRTISGMLAMSSLAPVPCYILEALWRPLYMAVCALNNANPAHLPSSDKSALCPSHIREYLANIGAVSHRVLVSSSESKTMSVPGHLHLPIEKCMPDTNILLCGEASANELVAEALLGVLPGFRVVKLSLPQVLREGHDSIANGLVSLTRKGLTLGQSDKIALYCPNIHDWLHPIEAEESESQLDQDEDIALHGNLLLWNSFIQALQNRKAGSKLLVLATCNLARDSIPAKVTRFFQEPGDFGKLAMSKRIIETGDIRNKMEALTASSSKYLVHACSFLYEAAKNVSVEWKNSRLDLERLVSVKQEDAVVCTTTKEDRQEKETEDIEIVEVDNLELELKPDKERLSEEKDSIGAEKCGEPLSERTCCVCLDTGANLKCAKCPTEVNSKYLKYLGCKSSKDWICGLCERKQCYSEHDIKEILALESKTIKWIGATLSNDQRCGLTHRRSSDSKPNAISVAFLDIAKNACKGKYTVLKHLKAAAKLALDEMLQQQSSVDSLAVRKGLAQKYFVSTSAAFATMDKIESCCWKFDEFIEQKFPKLEGEGAQAQVNDSQERKLVTPAKCDDGSGPSLQPKVFEMPLDGGADKEKLKQLVLEVAEILKECLQHQKKIGNFADCIGRVLTQTFVSISDMSVAGGGKAQEFEESLVESVLKNLLSKSIHRCLGSP